jgi:anthranilate phosphoribosyltransferase
MTTIHSYIQPLLEGQDLSLEQSLQLLDIVFAGDVPEVQIAALLTAMRAKNVTSPELAGLAQSLRNHAVNVDVDVDCLVDTCGTGGGTIKTSNISTAAAIVAAGAGAYIAKHGNRGITSKCGSADVLEELGVKIDAGADTVAECIQNAHIGFMFAPMFHPAMRYVQPIRKALGFRTVFNMLGPLANPANAHAQILGVADESLMETIAGALKLLGTRRAMVVHSCGIDEISTIGPTRMFELKDGQITRRKLDPEDCGIALASVEQLRVDDAGESARVLRDIVGGRETGPRKDVVVLNAAAALIVSNLADDFPSAIALAEASIRDGKAAACLEELIELSNRA